MGQGDRILMGVVGRAHGVRGLVRVHSYTADPRDLAGYTLCDEAGQSWTVAWRGDGDVAELRGPDGPLRDRTAAEALVNLRLYADRAQLPSAGEDEFYLADLVGMAAVDQDGAALGRVSQVHDYGAGASLELDRIPVLIVPFTKACVPVVDVAARRLVIVPPDEIPVAGAALAEPDAASAEVAGP